MCGATFDVARNRELLTQVELKISQPNFWNDQQAAQKTLQERKQVEDRLAADTELARCMSEIEAYIELAQEERDAAARTALLDEAGKYLADAETFVAGWETKTLLAGESDRLNAIVTIKSGAGGTESQDWAEMLLRMYLRWCESRGIATALVDSAPGEEAGLKSATVRIEGENAYGLLAGESGVHRLVRISPFDQAARRHTSFASVFVIPEVDEEIEIDVKPEELRVDTFRAGGHGGQNVNKVETAVRITHIPSGIVVQCQNERSQHKNREIAMRILRSRLYEAELEKRQAEHDALDAGKKDISFGSQIRSYVLAPYRLVKDHRTKFSMGDVDRVLNGDLNPFIHSYLLWRRDPKAYEALQVASDSPDDV